MDAQRDDYVSVPADRPATARDPLLPRPSRLSAPYPDDTPLHRHGDTPHPSDARAPLRRRGGDDDDDDDPTPPLRPLHLLLGLNIALALVAIALYLVRNVSRYYYLGREAYSYPTIALCLVSALADFLTLAALCHWHKALKRFPGGRWLAPIARSEPAHAALAVVVLVAGNVTLLGWTAGDVDFPPVVLTFVCVYVRPWLPPPRLFGAG